MFGVTGLVHTLIRIFFIPQRFLGIYRLQYVVFSLNEIHSCIFILVRVAVDSTLGVTGVMSRRVSRQRLV